MRGLQRTGDWSATGFHPELPGEELTAFGLRDTDDVCMYDDENSEAYLIGPGIEVGTSR